jgi:hypothetical protein
LSDAIRRCLQLAVGLLLTCAAAAANAQAQASESELKAAYLYRFLSFIEWPPQRFASREAPIVIAVVAAPELADELQAAVRGRTAQERAIVVRPLGPGESPRGAHVLFVGDAAAGRLAALSAAADRATLVVGDGESALDRGAIIAFVEDQGRLRFMVALDAAERAGLRISSRMLAVASEVRPRRQ